ncbi:hypothetical protein ACFL6I_27690, partial [candidate division KSB1 bacterium]
VYILIGLLLLFASIKAGLAVEEDFNAYASQKDIYVCSCALAQDNIVVENTGDVTSTYSVKQSGAGTEFSSLTENAFNLKPGESKTITNFVRAPCDIKGDYDLNTEFETVFGQKKEFTQTVTVKDCVNINLVMLETSLPVCPCSPAKYTFWLENTGTFLETYKLFIDSDYAEISEDILILEPQQGENVTVFITTPCGSYGDLEFTLNSYAEKSKMLAEFPFILRVAPCYNYTMESNAQYSVCQNMNNVIPINIKNTADVKNTYLLDADAEWAIFENSSFTLWGGEKAISNLNVYPVNIEPANYNITVNALTMRGEIRKSLNLAANVENCYSMNLMSPYEEFQVVISEESFIGLVLENDGTRASEYSLNITGAEWVTLEPLRVGLDPGTNKEIKLNYNVPTNATGTHEVLVYANMVDFPDKVKVVAITLEVVSVEDAYMVEIDTPVEKLETNFDGKVIPLTITNVGIREGKYNLALSGNNWTSLNMTDITVNPQETKTIGLVLNPIVNVTPEGKYDTTIDAVIEDTNIAYTRTFDVKLRQKTLWEKVSDFFSEYWIYMLLALIGFLILIGLIIGAIVYRKKHPKEEKKVKETLIEKEKPSWLKRILLILLILLILSGLGLAGYYFAFRPLFMGNFTNSTNMTPVNPTPVPPPSTDPITNATIFVNRTGLRGYDNIIEIIGLENITIPLTIQNSDEPNTYIIRVSENVSWVRTDKEVVNIPPSKKETINILVTPTPEVKEGYYNLSININIAGRDHPISEEIVLSIKDKEPFYEKYLWYLIGGIIALIVLLALIKWKEKREKDDFEELDSVKKGKEKKEPADYSKLKNILMILILVLITLFLIGALAYVGIKYIPSIGKTENATDDATVPVEEEEEVDDVPEEVFDVPEENYERVLIKKGLETFIPVKISNVNKTTAFKINVKEDVDWLYVDNDFVVVGPDENKTINLIASPNETVEDGDYKVGVDINIAQGEKVFSRYFILKVRKSKFSDVWSYLYYVLAGIVMLLVVIAILGRKWSKSEGDIEKKE